MSKEENKNLEPASRGASRQGSGDYLYLPWKQDPEYPCDLMDCAGQGIGSMDKEHDAAFVVHAVNCHDELVSALKHITALHVKAECLGHDVASGKDRKLLHDTEFCSGCHALAALAAAEGRTA